MVFFVIEIKSRAVEIAGIAIDPGEAWMKHNAADGEVACRSRLGGMLNYYYREAA